MTLPFYKHPIFKKICVISSSLIALFVVVTGLLVGVFWQNNQAAGEPIPFRTEGLSTDGLNGQTEIDPDLSPRPIEVVASDILQEPLQAAAARFKRRYPNAVLRLNYQKEQDIPAYVVSHPDVDMVLAKNLTLKAVSKHMQAEEDSNNDPYNASSHIFNIAVVTPDEIDSKDDGQAAVATTADYNRIQGLTLDEHSDATLLTFKQFLLSSDTQSLFDTEAFDSIETNQNAVKDLFHRQSSLTDKAGSEDVVDRFDIEHSITKP